MEKMKKLSTKNSKEFKFINYLLIALNLGGKSENTKKINYTLTLFPLIFIISFILSLFIGRLWFEPNSIFTDSLAKNILLNVRLPRLIAVSLSGACLALSGVALQNLFKNYLAGPNILGVTSGSAFGAVLAILLISYNPYAIQISAFLSGIVAMALTYTVGKKLNGSLRTESESSIINLVLAGIAVSALFSAGVGLIKYVANPTDKLQAITYWLLGSFTGIRWDDVYITVIPLIICIIGLNLLKWQFNILSMGEENAKSLGLNVKKYSVIIILLATLGTSSATAMAGMVQWIGLVSPHIARLVVGVDNRRLIPASMFTGASLLLICDTIARSLTPSELPLSVMTSIIGVPILLKILIRNQNKL
ncbi:iron complex transport system permease protein [Methanococcus voltae]|uniref:FecCD family ABC transporter permease n=1 Tax=Methanococcus voltae TaxID=2188 RepID=UPI001FD87873|nr:iron ABC transporter permease [Methanococcus voltae]MBP2143743.1 iron complex transport system permease protein [Methanococcus voltae]